MRFTNTGVIIVIFGAKVDYDVTGFRFNAEMIWETAVTEIDSALSTEGGDWIPA